MKIIMHPCSYCHLDSSSGKSYFDGFEDELIEIVEYCVKKGFSSPGRCSGVLDINVPNSLIDGFYSGQVKVERGDLLIGNIDSRHEGETLQENVYVLKGHKPADSVKIAIYSFQTLKEENDTLCNQFEFDYAIVFIGAMINGSPQGHNPSSALRNLIATFMPDDPRGNGGTAFENKNNLCQAEFMMECFRYYLDCKDEWRGWKMTAPTNLVKQLKT